MNFTYEPSFEDNFHGVLFGFWGTPGRALRTALMCLALGVLATVSLLAMRLPWQWAVSIALVGSIAWGALFTVGFGAWLAASLTKRQRTLGETRIAVTEAGVERTSGAVSIKQDWNGISRVVETGRVFFLYDADRPVFAIEKSAVRSSDALSELRRFLRERKPGKYLAE